MNSSILLPSNPRDDGVWNDLLQHLDEYRRRKLSHESDTLNAFRGILAKSGLRSYWGVPLRDTMPAEMGLAYGLLWKISATRFSSQQRRPGFPTWTWASTAYLDTPFIRQLTWEQTFHLRVAHAQIRLASEHTHAVQNFEDVAKLSANSIITEHGRCLLLTSYVAPCTLRLGPHSRDDNVTWVDCWVNAPFLHSSQPDIGHLDPEGIEELRTSHRAFGDGGYDEYECEAIMMLWQAGDIDWMLIIRKSSFYVRLGILQSTLGNGEEPWAPTPLEQTTIDLH
jgi:hypothetical protein